MSTGSMKKGQKKRVQGEVRRITESLVVEKSIYESLAVRAHNDRVTCRCDILEGMAGYATVSRMAADYGLRAMEPCDVI